MLNPVTRWRRRPIGYTPAAVFSWWTRCKAASPEQAAIGGLSNVMIACLIWSPWANPWATAIRLLVWFCNDTYSSTLGIITAISTHSAAIPYQPQWDLPCLMNSSASMPQPMYMIWAFMSAMPWTGWRNNTTALVPCVEPGFIGASTYTTHREILHPMRASQNPSSMACVMLVSLSGHRASMETV